MSHVHQTACSSSGERTPPAAISSRSLDFFGASQKRMANKDLVRLMAPRQAVSSLVSHTRDRRLLSDSLRCQSIDCRLLERLSSDCRISTGSRRRPYPSRAVLRRLSIGAVADADDGGYWRNMPGTSASQEVSSEVDYIFICRIGFDLGIVDFKVESDLTLESLIPKSNRIRRS